MGHPPPAPLHCLPPDGLSDRSAPNTQAATECSADTKTDNTRLWWGRQMGETTTAASGRGVRQAPENVTSAQTGGHGRWTARALQMRQACSSLRPGCRQRGNSESVGWLGSVAFGVPYGHQVELARGQWGTLGEVWGGGGHLDCPAHTHHVRHRDFGPGAEPQRSPTWRDRWRKVSQERRGTAQP